MITIFTDKTDLAKIQSLIDSEPNLNEIVFAKLLNEQSDDKDFLIVEHQIIKVPIKWSDENPPFLFSNEIQYSDLNLLALVYLNLNNFEKAYHFAAKNPDLLFDMDLLNRLQNNIVLDLPEDFPNNPFEISKAYKNAHNIAVLAHYGNCSKYFSSYQIEGFYKNALDLAPNGEFRAFTGKHYATLMLDGDNLVLADEILAKSLEDHISEDAKFELLSIQYAIWIKQLVVPYDQDLLEKTKNAIWEVLKYHEEKANTIQIALLLIDASHVSNLENSFSESLGYISRAINILSNENIPELLANAQYHKGVLLFTWAQSGSPQFYRPAMDAYLQALKVFNQYDTPEVFAEIQHHLGVIYSEIPDEVKKKSIWAAVSISSFNQALDFFTRETHPYEFAMICNNYGNAFTKYPEGVKSDNCAKALGYYRKSLEIRTAEDFPTERALTILNFLEAALYVTQNDTTDGQLLLDEMTSLAKDIQKLTLDPKLLEDAERHLQNILNLEKIF